MDTLIKIALFASYSATVVYFLQVILHSFNIHSLKNNKDIPPLFIMLGVISNTEAIKEKILYRILPLTIFTSLLTWGF